MMMMMMASSSGWALSSSSSFRSRSRSRSRRKPSQTQSKAKNFAIVASKSNGKRANLSASRIQRVELPVYDNTKYHISQFLSHPSGIQAILNTSALQNFQFLDTNTYRCTLPKLTLLNFEATPVLDLRVIPTLEDCTVELFSCKFMGSKVLEQQNDHFSATMINHITWDTNISEPILEVDVKLNLSLEVVIFFLDRS
ncbi:hypothetical protein CCACVL1_23138 [Corchorus capsularis]|uniref:Uncharacterized protein n=1 Tax=Corchorus capsularis TaxID=210143 RepID=A0A1R3GUY6_COCAP|nr:hypothetical protein CCACVL1_23138 [Corchorus capsularis]